MDCSLFRFEWCIFGVFEDLQLQILVSREVVAALGTATPPFPKRKARGVLSITGCINPRAVYAARSQKFEVHPKSVSKGELI